MLREADKHACQHGQDKAGHTQEHVAGVGSHTPAAVVAGHRQATPAAVAALEAPHSPGLLEVGQLECTGELRRGGSINVSFRLSLWSAIISDSFDPSSPPPPIT